MQLKINIVLLLSSCTRSFYISNSIIDRLKLTHHISFPPSNSKHNCYLSGSYHCKKTNELAMTQSSVISITTHIGKLFASSRSSPWQLWTAVSMLSTVGILSEQTQIGSMLSSPIVTMVAALFLSNLGIIPAASPVYNCVLKHFVPLAIPLLLLDADLRKCIRVTGRLLQAFIIGSIGTVAGTFVAYYFIPMKGILGGEKIAAALCARHVS